MSNLPTTEQIKKMSDADLVSITAEGANITQLDPFSEDGKKLVEILAYANAEAEEDPLGENFKLKDGDREFLTQLLVAEEEAFNRTIEG
jgi:hypothetical protein